MNPDDLARIGLALFGPSWTTPLADALSVHRDTVQKWKSGKSRPPPGIRAEAAELLRKRAAESIALASELEASVEMLHGLTTREMALVGWLISGYAVIDGDDWLSAYAEPARVLRDRVARELGDGIEGGRVKLSDGEADRLLTSLGRLSGAQAVAVSAAAIQLERMGTLHVPDA